mmetsp:Transcript_4465/g.6567  ORF Transcript_4465/g.6567 Transcript_4465/m.6567 type:complete len:148 (+) Transcript_4465:235-678(+)
MRGRSKKKGNSCNGDSGGPLIVAGDSALTDIQVGIVSWGPRKCLGNAAVYSRVSWAYDWIEDTMKNKWGLTLGEEQAPTVVQTEAPTPAKSECKDDPKFRYMFKKGGRDKVGKCKSFSKNKKTIEKYCKIDSVFCGCKKMCSNCGGD